ncbi:MAG: lycopene cyclase domain-containing protein [Caldilineaceae bacterium]
MSIWLMSHYTYLIWLSIFLGLPLLVLLRWGHWLWRQRRALALTLLGSLVGGWGWDALAVRFRLWHYDPNNIVGLWYWGLPLEEWLWIIGTTLLFGGLTVILMERAQPGSKQ